MTNQENIEKEEEILSESNQQEELTPHKEEVLDPKNWSNHKVNSPNITKPQETNYKKAEEEIFEEENTTMFQKFASNWRKRRQERAERNSFHRSIQQPSWISLIKKMEDLSQPVTTEEALRALVLELDAIRRELRGIQIAEAFENMHHAQRNLGRRYY